MKPSTGDTRVQKILTKRSGKIYDGMKARAKKEYQTLPFTKPEFRAWLLPKFDSSGTTKCEYSGAMLLAEDFQIDHCNPIDRTGEFGLCNLALCSEAENLRKGNMTVDEYRGLKKYVNFFLPPGVRDDFWKRLEIGDVQRYSHFRRLNKAKKGSR